MHDDGHRYISSEKADLPSSWLSAQTSSKGVVVAVAYLKFAFPD
jgi:hypothetical protein